jgi:N-acetylglucosamine-6-phosphate deacetylase
MIILRGGYYQMSVLKSLLIKNPVVFSEGEQIPSGVILVQEGKVKAIGRADEIHIEDTVELLELPETYRALPGFIDLHIHGANGSDTMDSTDKALETIASSLPKEGTTSFLATTVTQGKKRIEKALSITGDYIRNKQRNENAEILGIHLEGPFINPKKAGAQPIQHIIAHDIELFEKWLKSAKETILLVTLAPELPDGLEMVEFIKEKGIIASIGHSDATFEEVQKSIASGATHITHLFNQMRGLHHREPGVVGAAFMKDDLMVELIADGIHISPEMVKLSFQQITADRLILITDAMRAKFLKNGEYDLGGQKVFVENKRAILADGTLAGSVLTMADAFKNILHYTGCSLEEAVQMCSVNPAKQIGVFDRKGSLTVGKDADIVILDENLDVFMTICKGHLSFRRGARNND